MNLTLDFNLILTGFLIGWFIVFFEPLNNFLIRYVQPILKWSPYLYKMTMCLKCTSFWSTLIIGFIFSHFAPLEAIMAALIAYVFEKVMANFKTYL